MLKSSRAVAYSLMGKSFLIVSYKKIWIFNYETFQDMH